MVDADFEDSVSFYRSLGLDRRETTEGPVRVAFFETPSAEFHLVVRERRGAEADRLLDAIGRYDAAHVAFAVSDLASAVADAKQAGLSFFGDPPEAGLCPYRRAFVVPEERVGIPFEFVEPQ